MSYVKDLLYGRSFKNVYCDYSHNSRGRIDLFSRFFFLRFVINCQYEWDEIEYRVRYGRYLGFLFQVGPFGIDICFEACERDLIRIKPSVFIKSNCWRDLEEKKYEKENS